MSRPVSIVASVAALWLASASQVAAQQAPTISAGVAAQTSIVRTTTDHAAVWRRSPSQLLATLPIDVDLEAIAKEGQWYLVRLPEKYALPGLETGYVFEGRVRLVSGPPPPTRAPATSTSGVAETKHVTPPAPFFRVRGYGSVAYEWFLANDSFNAVLGHRGGLFYGGGGQVIFGHLFADVGFEHFSKTGQRVIVLDGDVFPLGIADTITMEPLTVSGGYRFKPNRKSVAYGGGGYTSLRFRETAEFADPGENTDERFNGFVILGGVEYAVHKWVFVSGEARFTGVQNAIGAPGVAAEFNESNLGGFSVALKVSVGN
jgi:opacity protein-like surface antigen